MTYLLKFHHGDRVVVLDRNGDIEFRGAIVGRHESRHGPHYDAQPDRAFSMSKRVVGIAESRIRAVSRPVLAYERKPSTEPKHVLDEA